MSHLCQCVYEMSSHYAEYVLSKKKKKKGPEWVIGPFIFCISMLWQLIFQWKTQSAVSSAKNVLSPSVIYTLVTRDNLHSPKKKETEKVFFLLN